MRDLTDEIPENETEGQLADRLAEMEWGGSDE